MSSWFSYFGYGNPAEESTEPQPSTSTPDPALKDLPEEQRRHIRDVLERAERSKGQAKVVMDSEQLHRVRLKQQRRDSASGSSFDEMYDDENDEELLQMDFVPETVEVSLGPDRDCSPFPMSDMSVAESGMSNVDERCESPSISIDLTVGGDQTPEPGIVGKGMRLLSQKIIDWVKSLDEEDGYVAPKAEPTLDELREELAEMFYEGSPLDDYCAQISRHVCILGVAEYMARRRLDATSETITVMRFGEELSELVVMTALQQIALKSRPLIRISNDLMENSTASLDGEDLQRWAHSLAESTIRNVLEEIQTNECYALNEPKDQMDSASSVDDYPPSMVESVETAIQKRFSPALSTSSISHTDEQTAQYLGSDREESSATSGADENAEEIESASTPTSGADAEVSEFSATDSFDDSSYIPYTIKPLTPTNEEEETTSPHEVPSKQSPTGQISADIQRVDVIHLTSFQSERSSEGIDESSESSSPRAHSEEEPIVERRAEDEDIIPLIPSSPNDDQINVAVASDSVAVPSTSNTTPPEFVGIHVKAEDLQEIDYRQIRFPGFSSRSQSIVSAASITEHRDSIRAIRHFRATHESAVHGDPHSTEPMEIKGPSGIEEKLIVEDFPVFVRFSAAVTHRVPSEAILYDVPSECEEFRIDERIVTDRTKIQYPMEIDVEVEANSAAAIDRIDRIRRRLECRAMIKAARHGPPHVATELCPQVETEDAESSADSSEGEVNVYEPENSTSEAEKEESDEEFDIRRPSTLSEAVKSEEWPSDIPATSSLIPSLFVAKNLSTDRPSLSFDDSSSSATSGADEIVDEPLDIEGEIPTVIRTEEFRQQSEDLSSCSRISTSTSEEDDEEEESEESAEDQRTQQPQLDAERSSSATSAADSEPNVGTPEEPLSDYVAAVKAIALATTPSTVTSGADEPSATDQAPKSSSAESFEEIRQSELENSTPTSGADEEKSSFEVLGESEKSASSSEWEIVEKPPLMGNGKPPLPPVSAHRLPLPKPVPLDSVLSPEVSDNSSATSGADSPQLSEESFDEIPPAAVIREETDQLTAEELAHIENVRRMAEGVNLPFISTMSVQFSEEREENPPIRFISTPHPQTDEFTELSADERENIQRIRTAPVLPTFSDARDPAPMDSRRSSSERRSSVATVETVLIRENSSSPPTSGADQSFEEEENEEEENPTIPSIEIGFADREDFVDSWEIKEEADQPAEELTHSPPMHSHSESTSGPDNEPMDLREDEFTAKDEKSDRSSITSGADDIPSEISAEETEEEQKKPPRPPRPSLPAAIQPTQPTEEELNEEEKNHIERIKRMAAQMSLEALESVISEEEFNVLTVDIEYSTVEEIPQKQISKQIPIRELSESPPTSEADSAPSSPPTSEADSEPPSDDEQMETQKPQTLIPQKQTVRSTDTEFTPEEIEESDRVKRLSNEFLSELYTPENALPIQTVEGALASSELTEEEIAHIQRIQKMAEEMTAAANADFAPETFTIKFDIPAEPKTEELTAEEIAHIERIQRMAEESETQKPTASEESQQKETVADFIRSESEATSVADSVPEESEATSAADSPKSEATSEADAELSEPETAAEPKEELTAAELEHIAKIAAMAAEMEIAEPAASQPAKAEELTAEELAHIAKIAAMAADMETVSAQYSVQNVTEPKTKEPIAEAMSEKIEIATTETKMAISESVEQPAEEIANINSVTENIDIVQKPLEETQFSTEMSAELSTVSANETTQIQKTERKIQKAETIEKTEPMETVEIRITSAEEKPTTSEEKPEAEELPSVSDFTEADVQYIQKIQRLAKRIYRRSHNVIPQESPSPVEERPIASPNQSDAAISVSSSPTSGADEPDLASGSESIGEEMTEETLQTDSVRIHLICATPLPPEREYEEEEMDFNVSAESSPDADDSQSNIAEFAETDLQAVATTQTAETEIVISTVAISSEWAESRQISATDSTVSTRRRSFASSDRPPLSPRLSVDFTYSDVSKYGVAVDVAPHSPLWHLSMSSSTGSDTAETERTVEESQKPPRPPPPPPLIAAAPKAEERVEEITSEPLEEEHRIEETVQIQTILSETPKPPMPPPPSIIHKEPPKEPQTATTPKPPLPPPVISRPSLPKPILLAEVIIPTTAFPPTEEEDYSSEATSGADEPDSSIQSPIQSPVESPKEEKQSVEVFRRQPSSGETSGADDYHSSDIPSDIESAPDNQPSERESPIPSAATSEADEVLSEAESEVATQLPRPPSFSREVAEERPVEAKTTGPPPRPPPIMRTQRSPSLPPRHHRLPLPAVWPPSVTDQLDFIPSVTPRRYSSGPLPPVAASALIERFRVDKVEREIAQIDNVSLLADRMTRPMTPRVLAARDQIQIIRKPLEYRATHEGAIHGPPHSAMEIRWSPSASDSDSDAEFIDIPTIEIQRSSSEEEKEKEEESEEELQIEQKVPPPPSRPPTPTAERMPVGEITVANITQRMAETDIQRQSSEETSGADEELDSSAAASFDIPAELPESGIRRIESEETSGADSEATEESIVEESPAPKPAVAEDSRRTSLPPPRPPPIADRRATIQLPPATPKRFSVESISPDQPKQFAQTPPETDSGADRTEPIQRSSSSEITSEADEEEEETEEFIAPPSRPSSPPKVSAEAEQLTEEEIAHIERIRRMAEEENVYSTKLTERSESEATSEADAEIEETEELTAEERAHIAKITAMAEEIGVQQYTAAAPKAQELTAEEIAHIERIQRMAEEADNAVLQQPIQRSESEATSEADAQISEPIEETEELTAEEIAHIERIQRMAEEVETTPQKVIQRSESEATSEADSQISEPTESNEEKEEELTAEEKAHIERIQRMAEEAEMFSAPVFAAVQPPKPDESVVESINADSEKGEEELTAEERAHIERIQRMAEEANLYSTPQPLVEESQPTEISAPPEELTAEEIAHIAKIQQMAEELNAETVKAAPPRPPPPPKAEPAIAEQSEELTAEELAHIQRIAEMAEKADIPTKPEEPKVETAELTAEELSHIEKIKQMAEEMGPVFQLPSRPVEETANKQKFDESIQSLSLTEEELAHIAEVRRMADRLSAFGEVYTQKPVNVETETVKEEIPEAESPTKSSETSGADMPGDSSTIASSVDLPDYPIRAKSTEEEEEEEKIEEPEEAELSQTEREHIERIKQLSRRISVIQSESESEAEQSEHSNVRRSSSEATSGADEPISSVSVSEAESPDVEELTEETPLPRPPSFSRNLADPLAAAASAWGQPSNHVDIYPTAFSVDSDIVTDSVVQSILVADYIATEPTTAEFMSVPVDAEVTTDSAIPYSVLSAEPIRTVSSEVEYFSIPEKSQIITDSTIPFSIRISEPIESTKTNAEFLPIPADCRLITDSTVPFSIRLSESVERFQEYYTEEIKISTSPPKVESRRNPFWTEKSEEKPKQSEELTKEELEHIEKIGRLAEQLNVAKWVKESIERSVSEETSGADAVASYLTERSFSEATSGADEPDSSAVGSFDIQMVSSAIPEEVTEQSSQKALPPRPLPPKVRRQSQIFIGESAEIAEEEPKVAEPEAKEEFELTAEEIAHIERIQKMAEEAETQKPTASEESQQKETVADFIRSESEATSIADSVPEESEATSAADSPKSEATSEADAELSEPETAAEPKEELTAAELEHIAKIAAMAAEMEIAEPVASQPAKAEELTAEELAHIAKIAAMAADMESTRYSASAVAEPKTEEQAIPQPAPAAQSEQSEELTAEELAHIAKITAMAEQLETMVTPSTEAMAVIPMVEERKPSLHSEEPTADQIQCLQRQFDSVCETMESENEAEEDDEIVFGIPMVQNVRRLSMRRRRRSSSSDEEEEEKDKKTTGVEWPTGESREKPQWPEPSGSRVAVAPKWDAEWPEPDSLNIPLIATPDETEVEEFSQFAAATKISAATVTRRLSTRSDIIALATVREEDEEECPLIGASPTPPPVIVIDGPKHEDYVPEEPFSSSEEEEIEEEEKPEEEPAERIPPPPSRPLSPTEPAETSEKLTEENIAERIAERETPSPSSEATSGADAEPTSSAAASFDYPVEYPQVSIVETNPSPVSTPADEEEPQLTAEEKEHIEKIKSLARRISGFDEFDFGHIQRMSLKRVRTVSTETDTSEAPGRLSSEFEESEEEETVPTSALPAVAEPIRETPIVLVTSEPPEEPKLTDEEIAHIEKIQRMAEEADNAVFQQPIQRSESEATSEADAQISEPIEETEELTAEERSHIEKIQRMAEEAETTPQKTIQRSESEATSEADTQISEPTESNEEKEEELTAEEKAHIERIQRMAEEAEMFSAPVSVIAPTSIVAVRPSEKSEAKKTEPNELTAEELAHIAKIAEMAEQMDSLPYQKPISEPTTAERPDELTAEELAHIAKIAEMAEQMSGQPPPPQQIPKAEKPEELTAEELAHIAKIAAMAEELNSLQSTEPPPSQIPTKQLIADPLAVAAAAWGEEEKPMEVIYPIGQLSEEENIQQLTENPEERNIQSPAESSATSGADVGGDSSTVVSSFDIPDYPIRTKSTEEEERISENEAEEEELEEAEREHIERVKRLSRRVSAIPSEPEDSEEPKAEAEQTTSPIRRSSSEATSGADEEISMGHYLGDSFEDRALITPSPFELESKYPIAEEEPEEVKIEVVSVAEPVFESNVPFIPPPSRLAFAVDFSAVGIAEPIPVTPEAERKISAASTATSEAMEASPPVEEPPLTREEKERIEKVKRMAEEVDYMETPVSEITSDADIELSEPLEEPPADEEPKLTEEECAHIERIKRMAESQQKETVADFIRSESEATSVADSVPEESESAATSGADAELSEPEIFEEENKEELTAEELSHIAKIAAMAAEMDAVVPQRPIQPVVETKAEELTAEELAHIAKITAMAEEIGVQQYTAAAPKTEELTAEELAHIERIQRMAEEADNAIFQQPIQRSESEATSEADAQISEPTESFEEKPKEELTAEELAHIERIERMAEEAEQQTAISQIERAESEATSGADAESPEPVQSFDEKNEDLTAEELAHIERIQRMAEETEAVTENPQFQRTESEATSGADAETPEKLSEEEKEELTAEELAHIERIQRLAEEADVYSTPVKIQRSDSESTSDADVEISAATEEKPKEELTAEELAHIERIQKMAEETDLYSVPTIQPAETETQLTAEQREQIERIAEQTELSERSHRSSISVSYTDRLRRSLPRELTRSVHSSFSVDEQSSPRRPTLAETKSTSVNIIYTDKKLSDDRSVDSFDGMSVSQIAAEVATIDALRSQIDTPTHSKARPSPSLPLNAFEWCERRSGRPSNAGNYLSDVDFMVKLNFMANRLTETIAEAAAEDLQKVIRMRNNPRARYFADDYLQAYIDSPESEEEETSQTPAAEAPLDYAVEALPNEPQQPQLGFGLFSLFGRRKSDARPKSAMAYLQKSASPIPESSRKSSEVKSGDVMELLRRSSISSDRSPLSRTEEFILPAEALENLSAEEREHIMKVMSSANRSPQSGSRQESRRSSSATATYPVVEMENLGEEERRHIESVLQKAEGREPPFVISSPAIPKSPSAELSPKLTAEELAHIARMEAMIAQSEAEDLRRVRSPASPRGGSPRMSPSASIQQRLRQSSGSPSRSSPLSEHSVSTPPLSQPSGFGFGSLKDTFKKTSQLVNQNVTTIVKTEILSDSIRKTFEKAKEAIAEPKDEEITEETKEEAESSDSEGPDEIREEEEEEEEEILEEEEYPEEQISIPTNPFLDQRSDSGLEAESPPPPIDETNPFSMPSEPTESIASLQKRIEAMNQTLEAYEPTEIKSATEKNLSATATPPAEFIDPFGRCEDKQHLPTREGNARSEGEKAREEGGGTFTESGGFPPLSAPLNSSPNAQKDAESAAAAVAAVGVVDNQQNVRHPNAPTASPTIQTNTLNMFGGKSKSGGFGGFGGFGKLASGALKGAQQLQQKAQNAAQAAQQAASASDLSRLGTQITDQLTASVSPQPTRSQSAANVAQISPMTPMGSSAVDLSSDIPPGLEHLSEEERMKIMAVMACAEIDAAAAATPAAISRPPPKAEPISVPSVLPVAALPSAMPPIEDSMPGIDPEVLSGLSAEEREQILAVMRLAQQEEGSQMPPVATPMESQPKITTTATKTVESGYASAVPTSSSSVATDLTISSQMSQEFPITVIAEPINESRDYVREEAEFVESEEIQMEEMITTADIQTKQWIEEDEEEDQSWQTTPAVESSVPKEAEEEDEDVWMQPPRQEYRLPNSWEPQPRRMWTTVFSDDGDLAASEYDDSAEVSILEGDEAIADSRATTRSPTHQIVHSSEQIPATLSHSELIYSSRDQQELMEMYGKSTEGSFEVQMEDPMSPTMTVSSAIAGAAIQRAEKEIRAPEIMVTTHEEKTPSDEDSDAETSPSSDEDDYPDQIIEAPSAPSKSLQQVEQEREAQEKYAQDLVRQIQSFGERANDEFDVQWAAASTQKPTEAPPAIPTEPQAEEEPQKPQRINPFLDAAEDEVNVTVENVDEEDLDYKTAVNYYRSGMPDQFHRPGPVYTIPEGDEDNTPSRDSRYNPQLLERRPLHGTTVPPLIPQDGSVSTKRKKKVGTAIPSVDFGPMPTAPTTQMVSSHDVIDENKAPITPVRTAPPPPDTIEEPQPPRHDHSLQTIKSKAHAIGPTNHFQTDIKQADDLQPLQHIHSFHGKLAAGAESPSCVSASDSAFLAQTFGVVVPPATTADRSYGTLGSQLASADHAVHEAPSAEGDDGATSRLKRSPAMILSSERQKETDVRFSFDTRSSTFGSSSVPGSSVSSAPLMSSIDQSRLIDEDALLHGTATITEMGRRKLPSLPAARHHRPVPSAAAISASLFPTASTTTTTTATAPIYYTSSAPEQRDVAVNGVAFSNIYFDSSTTAASRLVSTSALFTPKRVITTAATSSIPPAIVPSASSQLSPMGRLYGHPVDPAIIPGAPFKGSPRKPMSVRTTIRSSSAPKFPDPMSQLLFKQELRQVLSRRRMAQETAEIEANNREYMITRMLNSGLMPEDYRREIDSQPDVVKCDLPPEIVAGVRIVPEKNPIRGYREQQRYGYGRDQRGIERSFQFVDQRFERFDAFRNADGLRIDTQRLDGYRSGPSSVERRMAKKSIGVQCEASPVMQRTRFDDLRFDAVASTSELPFERLESWMRTPRSRPVDSATQTMVASETQTEPSLVGSRSPRRIPKPSNNLYHPVDRSAPDLLESTRKYFEEYDRRLREATAAFDGRRFQFDAATDSPTEMEWKRRQVLEELERRKQKVASMIDLRSLRNRFGEIPQDYTATIAPHYGSLPRLDYSTTARPSRPRAPTNYIPQQQQQQQQRGYYGSLPRDFERMAADPLDYGVPPVPPRNDFSRSLHGIDGDRLFDTAGYRRNFAFDDIAVPKAPTFDPQRPYRQTAAPSGDDLILSQYASYVNDQINAAGFLDEPQYPTQRQQQYGGEQIITDPYIPNYSTQFQQQMMTAESQPIPQYPQYYPTELPPRPTADYVYSRNEANYGSRPMQPIGDYGNPHLNRRQLEDYLNRNLYEQNRMETQRVYPTPNIPYSYGDQRTPVVYNNNYDERWPSTLTYPRSYTLSTQPPARPQPYGGSYTTPIATPRRSRRLYGSADGYSGFIDGR